MTHLRYGLFVFAFVSACSANLGKGEHDSGPAMGADARPGSTVDAAAPLDGGSEFVDNGDLFVPVTTPGYVAVTLHPGPTVTAGQVTRVAFGVPFPPGAIEAASQLRVQVAGGGELPSHIEELARWRSLDPSVTETSLRAALIITEVTFPSAAPMTIELHYGVAHGATLTAPGTATDTWVSISENGNPDEYPAADNVREPAVYATLPPEWLSACLLRTRTTAIDADAAWSFWDTAYPSFGRTAVNDVSPAVDPTNLIDYVTQPAPWLFDRTLTLFGLYVRTGSVDWLRRAHRSAQFYARHIGADGYFDLKPGDLKYSYGASLFVDLMLTGDTGLVPPIERIAAMASTWGSYTESANFWTERHQAYALLAAVVAWEATGQAEHATRSRQLAAATFQHALSPPFGWPVDGCNLHTSEQHGEGGGDNGICSPWMSSLLADAVWRYYIQSRDAAALTYLANLGDFVREHALYDGVVEHPSLAGYSLPRYLVSSFYAAPGDAWADWEHACDVAGLVARAAWARKALGGDHSALETTARAMLDGCAANLDYWHRPDSDINNGLAPWRLSPPRKFNWWFGTTADLPWLLSQL